MEFTRTSYSEFLLKFGQQLQLAEPDKHEHHRTSEKFLHTPQERARTLLFEFGFLISCWSYAFTGAGFIYKIKPLTLLQRVLLFMKNYLEINLTINT